MPSKDRSDVGKRENSKPHARRNLPRLRLRTKRKVPLELEDFDDVRYKMEIVRTGDNDNDSEDNRVALLELAFLTLFCMLLLGGCVAVGFATHLIEYSREMLSLLLPMLLLPLAWVIALLVWEHRAVTIQSKIATE